MRLTLLLSVLAITGCGGSDTTGNDSGTDGSANDATVNDASSDGTVSDATKDAPVTDGGGGHLDAGATCDMKNDQCDPGLKCCAGGAIQPDASVGHCTVPTDAGTCPLVP